jgi:pimeloyl-ACP methyl ester carboxylesterase
MKQWKIILIPVVLAYLTILGLFLLAQRTLIYRPTPLNGDTPQKYGLHYQDVSFPSSDGITITGWWIQHPQGKTPRPVLLYCHGNGANISLLSEVSRLFYDFGFDELLFDYRSFGASQHAPLSEIAVDADALAAYHWIQTRGVPENRMLIWGHSLGSSVAAWLATQTHPAGLILEGAFPSTRAISTKRYPWLLVFPFMIQDPFDTEAYVQKRTCPLLEFHAEKDTIIPIDLGERVFAKAVEPKQFVVVKGIDHNDFPSVAEEYKDVVMNFTKGCLKQAATR